MTIDLSIIIPAFNEELRIGEQLAALASQEWPGHSWEVLVVDNNSTDRTAAVAASFEDRIPNLKVVLAADRQGLSYARNFGVHAARSNRLAICDADDVVAPGWVAALGSSLEQHQFVTGLLEVDLLNPSWLADSRGRASTAGPSRFHGFFLVASGGNLGMHRELWERVGGFSERFTGAEDIHFSMEAWLLGYQLHHEPQAVLHYRYRSDAGSLWRQGRRYGRARTALCCEMRSRGLRPRRLGGLRSWAWLLVKAPTLLKPQARLAWVWVAANRLGQLEASIRHCSLYV